MFGSGTNLFLPAVPRPFALGKLVKQRREDKERKLRRPRQARGFIGGVLEPGMQVEGLSLDEHVLEQVVLEPVKPGFHFLPFEPGFQVEPASFIEVQVSESGTHISSLYVLVFCFFQGCSGNKKPTVASATVGFGNSSFVSSLFFPTHAASARGNMPTRHQADHRLPYGAGAAD
jgi:hypothetical protein